jgi:2-polyprenyl-3-methyl-5-hydroxy-6-metoxy-1,4-benzoquinol methylase
MNQKNVKEYIRALEHVTSFLRSLLEEENKTHPFPKGERERLSEITELRMLTKSDVWPEAVPVELICGESEEEKESRATGIIQDFISTEVAGKSFLDFGCGEGHVANAAVKNFEANKAVGYDIKEQKNWKNFEENTRFKLTNNWEEVKTTGPYEIILVNDVLDHSKDPLDILRKVQEVKLPQLGKVHLRLHPWTSRHGTHLYKTLNKAYLHLIFTDQELLGLGLEETETLKIKDPEKVYKEMIKEAGFTIVSENKITQPLELFFTHTPEILRRIKNNWNKDAAFPREILEIQFIDFVLI